jgi:hypothetical protein
VTTAGTFFAVAIILGSLNFILEQKEFIERPNSHPTWWKALELKLTGEGSLAFLSIGAIALLLELPHLSKYFQTKVANTIRGKEYLKTLKNLELETLQADALKALWELEDIGGEDGLYNYAKTKVTACIAQPYRENILGLIEIKLSPEAAACDAYAVEETISYTCRAVRKREHNEVKNHIQKGISWTTEKGEIRKLERFRIRLEVPAEIFEDADFKKAHPTIRRAVEVFDKDDPPKAVETMGRKIVHAIWLPNIKGNSEETSQPSELKKYENGDGYSLSLAAYEDVDKLDVKFYVKYLAPIGRSFTWQMTHPSRNITGLVTFPPELSFHLETFGVSLDHLRKDRDPALDSPQPFRYSSWLLPDSGFVFHFFRPHKNEVAGKEPLEAHAEMVPAQDDSKVLPVRPE